MSAFDKIIGYESIKAEMYLICDILKCSEMYGTIGVTIPKGVLLYGEPGVGKSMMAEAIIAESGRKTFTIRKDRPDGEFVSYIKDTFERAASESPSIVYMDDMDKFANGDMTHRDAEEYVTVQSCIDECRNKDVFVLATVNDINVLPGSLIRAGRFDKSICMECPVGEDAEKIVEYFLSQKRIQDDVDATEIARILDGRSCAELETIVNEAGMYAAYDKRDRISHRDIIKACLRYIYDVPEDITVKNKNDNLHVAIHEAGHALVAELLDSGSVNLVSVSNNDSGIRGITSITKPKGYWSSKELMEHRVIGILAGRAATEIVTNTVDAGSNDDISRAFKIVERLVDNLCSYGFTSFERHNSSKVPSENRDRRMAYEMERYYETAKKLIFDNRALLDDMVDMLQDKQIITGKDIRLLKDRYKIAS